MMFDVDDAGFLPFGEAWKRQYDAVEQVRRSGRSRLILCEHPTVLTLGRLAHQQHILSSREALARNGIAVVETDRGGEVTLHAPGQLVVYPIVRLDGPARDLHRYLHLLEETGIDFLDRFGIVSARVPGKTGVWVGERKVISIGIGVRRWVAFHGIGINISTDLSLFSLIRPCGLDVGMVSVAQILDRDVEMAAAKEMAVASFEACFNG